MTRQPDLFSDVRIRLAPQDYEQIRDRPVRSDRSSAWGGNEVMANQLRELVIAGGGTITLSNTALERVYRYAFKYGDGGYQSVYFRPIVAAAQRAGWKPPVLV